MNTTLMLLDKAAGILAKCTSVNEARTIRNQAQLLENYAKQERLSADCLRRCAIIKLRAERRIAQLLAGSTKKGRPKKVARCDLFKLRELGITKSQSSRWQLAATLPEKDFERYLAGKGELTTTAIVKLATARRRPSMGAASGGSILTGPASQLWDKLADGSVDLFLTDPPYDRIDLYGELAELAAAKLKTGRSCLAFCGQYHLPAVIRAMEKHLRWRGVVADRFGGPHHGIKTTKVANSWHAILAFSKGAPIGAWLPDMVESGGKEKDAHEWQKTLTDVEYLIEKLTDAGALVVDPYCGSGTVPAACRKLGRQGLGVEIDSKTARVARGRVAA